MKIALASDHTGLEAAHVLADFLASHSHEILKFYPEQFNPHDDYPDYVIPAAKALASGYADAAIILGGSGQGEAMAANRIKGVRCALFYGSSQPIKPVDIEGRISDNPFEIVELSRQHNLANALSLAVRFVDIEEMKRVIELWLNTPLGHLERHARRVKKLDELS